MRNVIKSRSLPVALATAVAVGVAAGAVVAVEAAGAERPASLATTSRAAGNPSVNLLVAFKSVLPKVRRGTAVPVLLPGSLPVAHKLKAYTTGSASKSGWALELASAPDCGEATACFVADFSAKKGGKLPRNANARLTGGDPVVFSAGSGSAPASLWFVHNGILYSWQHADLPAGSARATLIRLASEAVQAGPR